jgi:enoyl-CoA hydratase
MGFTRLTPAKPAIAAIRGWCVAGGLELALWCDLRVASEDARFGCLERRWGVPLIDGGTQRLPRVVGLGRALDLILTGREVDAQEALAMGLVNAVVPDPLARALELAETIAAFPQDTMLSDREATLSARGLELEARLGRERIGTALEGAQRFRVRP